MSASCVSFLVLSAAALTVALLLLCVGFDTPSPLPANLLVTDSHQRQTAERRLASIESDEQATPSSVILDPTTKELSPNTKYTDLVRALADEYMPGAEEEPGWESLEDSLRAMQNAERLGHWPDPTGPLANTTYDELRNAITTQYFASWRSKSHTRQFMSALNIMYKLEYGHNGGRPIPIEGQPYLFVGSAGPAYNLSALNEMNITHIISVTSGVRPQFPDEFEYLHIQGLRDEPKDPRQSLAVHFNQTTAFIDAARSSGGRCFVHCWEGRSRSVTVITAYLIQREEMTREAINSAIQDGGKVLVHCHQGLSRSVAILSAFLIRHKKTSAARALEIIRQTRSRAAPKQMFLEELERYAKEARMRKPTVLNFTSV